MRITFVSSSFEPGKDGVGDYARDLAAACQSLGLPCSLLALNDRHIDRVIEELQTSRTQTIECLRLPASKSLAQRLILARAWLSQIEPDLISLQFVAYGFHPKGLIGDLGRNLVSLFAARPVHLMLHELWIGTERGASLRHRIVGRLQRQAILSMIRTLNPRIIHTSNVAYAALLRRQGIRTRLLSLCGSIPIAEDMDSEWLARELQRLGVSAQRAVPRDSSWRFGLFGSLYPGWSPEPLFGYIAQAAQRAQRQVIIAAIGRQGAGAALWQSLQARYADRFSIVSLGERPNQDISTFFQSIDFGIGVTPWQIIGKSSSVAAMTEHGLPVVVSSPDNDYGTDGLASDSPLLYRMDADTPRWLQNVRPQTARIRLPEMAAQFVADVETQPQLTLPMKSGLLSLTPEWRRMS